MGPRLGDWGRLLLTLAAALTLPTRAPGSLGAQIIGGREVTPHSRPYMASVSFGGQHHCGGFLLRSRWVVSAAHCFSHRDPREALVVLGAHTLRPQEPTRQVFGIAAVTRHPDYQPATHANDICLLWVSRAATPSVTSGFVFCGAGDQSQGLACARQEATAEPLAPNEAEGPCEHLSQSHPSWPGHLAPPPTCPSSWPWRRLGRLCCAEDEGSFQYQLGALPWRLAALPSPVPCFCLAPESPVHLGHCLMPPLDLDGHPWYNQAPYLKEGMGEVQASIKDRSLPWAGGALPCPQGLVFSGEHTQPALDLRDTRPGPWTGPWAGVGAPSFPSPSRRSALPAATAWGTCSPDTPAPCTCRSRSLGPSTDGETEAGRQ
ncbi:serine protease 57 isoform X2 [Marmota monax]|uniref:serine protease 57 isoform X2 n=1 Tax=Marmota monax TaxID=9995 RepID=UPI0026EF0549|nr:serine protease 57 isoform X2 [Marmota monax]XP_058435260.1 serine protease 57 isoform X2 [Marmota monax]XP_058435261.1 serine protease 57 isoform X2 [Marmota monax]